MKTKLTFLLALAVSATASAEKPNFNGVRSVASAPAPRSAPSFSGGGSSHSFHVGQIIGIARGVLPPAMNAHQLPPQMDAAKRSSNRSLVTKKPVARGTSLPKPGVRNTTPKSAASLDPKLASSLNAGREIASGLQSLDSLRASFGSAPEFGNVFHQPGNPGRSDQSGVADPFNNDFHGDVSVSNPQDRFSNARPRDIRAEAKGSRRGLDSAGNGIMDGLVSDDSTESGTVVAVEVVTNPDGSGSTTETHCVQDENGQSRDVSVTQFHDSNGQTTGYKSVETVWGRCTSSTTVRGHDTSGRTTSSTTTGGVWCDGRRGCDRNPSEGAALGGSNGPGVGDVTGLMPLDLVRQYAEGKPSASGPPTSYTVTRRSGANQVRPASSESSQVGIAVRPRPAAITGQGLEGHGGVGGDNRPN